jgi:hypothetical protein
VQADEEDSAVFGVESNDSLKSKSKSLHSFKNQAQEPVAELDTSKPSAVFKPKNGRDWTLSIALPGSFIAKYGLACLPLLCLGRSLNGQWLINSEYIANSTSAPH